MKYLKVWTNFLELINTLQYDEIGRLFEMMLVYAESEKEPENFSGNERFLWPVAKQQIDLAAAKNEILRQNGMRGGRPKQEETKENQTEPEETKENQTKAYKEKKRKEIERNDNNNHLQKNILPLKRFTPPTVEEIKAYCDQRGVFLIDPQRFIDYYETRGWLLSKNRKMVDWKAAVRLWEKNERERQEKERFADADIPY